MSNMSTQSIAYGLALLVVSSSGFVHRPPAVRSLLRPRRHLQAKRPPTSDETSFWTLPFDNELFSITTKDSSSLVERLTGYANDVLDSWGTSSSSSSSDTFKPTGTDQTFLGRLQGYANGMEAELDNISDWILSYSDLTPDSELTVAGQAFLATNLAYTIAGAYLAQSGDVFFGLVTEITAVASFAYHYGQLESRGVNNLPAVRLALLIDYICAFFSIGLALLYLVTSVGGMQDIVTVLPPAVLSLGMLGASWIWVEGRPYMILHGLWHFFSAYTGFLVGALHAGTIM